MPPKGNGRVNNRTRGPIHDQRSQATRSSARNGKKASARPRSAIPEVYRELLVEVSNSERDAAPERPLKRRKVGRGRPEEPNTSALDAKHKDQSKLSAVIHEDEEDDEDFDFEDVLPVENQQTAYDSSGESDYSNQDLPDADYGNSVLSNADETQDLVLVIDRKKAPSTKSPTPRRKVGTKADRAIQLTVHKMNILCLLRFIDIRNSYCNDSTIQSLLRPLLSKRMIEYFRPKASNTQLGKAESVKRGLAQACDMWEAQFSITARGMASPVWAINEEELAKFKLLPDFDAPQTKEEFRKAAENLKGSRDIGAELFCAMLRSVGLKTRLVCSLQPLPIVATSRGATSHGAAVAYTEETPSDQIDTSTASNNNNESSSSISTARGNLNPNRTIHRPGILEEGSESLNPRNLGTVKKPQTSVLRLVESPYPVYWVEVIDEAHQKWIPVNPFAAASISRPEYFEPPASDPDNSFSYVIAFEEEGTARDVTRRYAKSFNAKVRKNRVEATDGGQRWWRRTLRFYSRGWKSDLDQIEDIELAAKEAQEPMPRSVADFKDHPVYALERHLRRNEVLLVPREVGKVASGRNANGKKLESVFRRSDVHLVKSADAWYRLGREVKFGEQPSKVFPARRWLDKNMEGNQMSMLYTESQTEPYEAPPIVNGRVPKNSFGNLDIYMPSMVPRGGLHVLNPMASRAAKLLGIDYADAVTGFQFRGRHGTAITQGVVVAEEYLDAMQAVLTGFDDEIAGADEKMKSARALRTWKRYLVSLRIMERVGEYEIEGEKAEMLENVSQHEESDSGMDSEEYIDDGGGGFFPE